MIFRIAADDTAAPSILTHIHLLLVIVCGQHSPVRYKVPFRSDCACQENKGFLCNCLLSLVIFARCFHFYIPLLFLTIIKESCNNEYKITPFCLLLCWLSCVVIILNVIVCSYAQCIRKDKAMFLKLSTFKD